MAGGIKAAALAGGLLHGFAGGLIQNRLRDEEIERQDRGSRLNFMQFLLENPSVPTEYKGLVMSDMAKLLRLKPQEKDLSKQIFSHFQSVLEGTAPDVPQRPEQLPGVTGQEQTQLPPTPSETAAYRTAASLPPPMPDALTPATPEGGRPEQAAPPLAPVGPRPFTAPPPLPRTLTPYRPAGPLPLFMSPEEMARRQAASAAQAIGIETPALAAREAAMIRSGVEARSTAFDNEFGKHKAEVGEDEYNAAKQRYVLGTPLGFNKPSPVGPVFGATAPDGTAHLYQNVWTAAGGVQRMDMGEAKTAGQLSAQTRGEMSTERPLKELELAYTRGGQAAAALPPEKRGDLAAVAAKAREMAGETFGEAAQSRIDAANSRAANYASLIARRGGGGRGGGGLDKTAKQTAFKDMAEYQRRLDAIQKLHTQLSMATNAQLTKLGYGITKGFFGSSTSDNPRGDPRYNQNLQSYQDEMDQLRQNITNVKGLLAGGGGGAAKPAGAKDLSQTHYKVRLSDGRTGWLPKGQPLPNGAVKLP